MKRNVEHFLEYFMFQLTKKEEYENLKSQFVTSRRGDDREKCMEKTLKSQFATLERHGGLKAEIAKVLWQMADKKYAAFEAKIIPTLDQKEIIGVRTVNLRVLAKKLSKNSDIEAFLNDLPHQYFEENQLHSFIVAQEKSFAKCIAAVEKFLPFIDNWATCDQFSPAIFSQNTEKLLPYIQKWIKSTKTYSVRLAIGLLMRYFLDEKFTIKYSDMVARIKTEEYYINMMRAWYFATALAKQYNAVLFYFEEKRLDCWTHNKAIQKSLESYRITDEQKQYLKMLKITNSSKK